MESTDFTFTVCDDIPVIGAPQLSLDFCHKITGFPAHRFPTTLSTLVPEELSSSTSSQM
ncbi:MAG: hypothetical protein KKI01_02640 [Proteobacteria bacterium]|nr:hypothetical protein [Pseudomonadota bacterium]